MTDCIESLPNVGRKSGHWLREAGITTIGELKLLGPVAAYRIVKHRQPKASLNLLWALAAGLAGQDWRQLPDASKQQLRKELNEAESNRKWLRTRIRPDRPEHPECLGESFLISHENGM